MHAGLSRVSYSDRLLREEEEISDLLYLNIHGMDFWRLDLDYALTSERNLTKFVCDTLTN